MRWNIIVVYNNNNYRRQYSSAGALCFAKLAKIKQAVMVSALWPLNLSVTSNPTWYQMNRTLGRLRGADRLIKSYRTVRLHRPVVKESRLFSYDMDRGLQVLVRLATDAKNFQALGIMARSKHGCMIQVSVGVVNHAGRARIEDMSRHSIFCMFDRSRFWPGVHVLMHSPTPTPTIALNCPVPLIIKIIEEQINIPSQ